MICGVAGAGMKLFAGVVLLLVLAGGGLAIYGSQVKPARHNVERVLPHEPQ